MIRAGCAQTGFWLTLIVSLIVVLNQYESLQSLTPFYRITMPAMCLVFSFVATSINIRLGLIGCMFALPLLPNLTWQIQQYFGYGRILSLHSAGLDLIAGFFLGALANQFFDRKKIIRPDNFPWPAGLAMMFVTISVVLAITRNLHQTASQFQVLSFLYNLTHLRSIGWHDDYRPLVDWIAYGCAFSLIAIVAQALRNASNRNSIIFNPLIISLIIAAIVGYRQSTYGIGLSIGQLNFRLDRFGYMALGFQHDIHAFAGQMLIGALGLFGYLYYTKSISTKTLILVCKPLCWIALFLSKSKSNFALAIVCLVAILFIWIFKRSRFLIPTIKILSILIILLLASTLIFKDVWAYGLSGLAHQLGLSDLQALNEKLSYRPEVYLAALKMFTLDPILGLGQSEFYRQSASFNLTNSHFLSIDQNGENAHNYFLQTLTETGLIGIAVFSFLCLYPAWKIRNKKLLIPAWAALGAVFIGNIFAHSMLVRENLFIAAGFIGLMYACAYAEPKPSKVSEPKPYESESCRKSCLPHVTECALSFAKQPKIIWALILALGVLAAREIYLSYRSEPFIEDVQCFKAQPLDPDGWTSGVYKIALPDGARGMTLSIKGTQPDVLKRPLHANISILHGESSLIEQSTTVFQNNGPSQLSINFPNGDVADDGEYRVELRLSRCFIPRNMLINADGRRLGIQIESSTPNY